jgi:hypothetical protein
MANVVMEHVILIPIMVIVILLFSTVANIVASNYIDQQNFLIAQEAVNQFASTIQQINYFLSQNDIMPSTVIKTNPLSETIISHPYKITCALEGPVGVESGRNLKIILSIQGTNIVVNKTVVLTQNTIWKDSEISSPSSETKIMAQKLTNGSILLSFK